MRKNHKESRLQAACVRWFILAHGREYGHLFGSSLNGVRLTETQRRIAHAEGMCRGEADLHLYVPRHGYHGLFIEMKTESEEWRGGRRTLKRTYQRPEQKEWQAKVEAQGYRYEVIRTVDEFIRAVEDYLSVTNHEQ